MTNCTSKILKGWLKGLSFKISQKEIQKLFGEYYIPTWAIIPKIDGKTVQRWPPTSLDLSTIKLICSIIKEMLKIFQTKNIYKLN